MSRQMALRSVELRRSQNLVKRVTGLDRARRSRRARTALGGDFVQNSSQIQVARFEPGFSMGGQHGRIK